GIHRSAIRKADDSEALYLWCPNNKSQQAKSIWLIQYLEKPELCPVKTLKLYLEKTEKHAEGKNKDTMFFVFKPSVKPASNDVERREIIQTCPRTEGINYSPPSINEVATTTIKKADTALYNTQSFLAQATRPIDYSVHKLLQKNENIGSDDPRIIFAATMRVILSETATMLTQGRVDNLHYGLNLQEKPTSVNQNEPDSLIDQETLEKLLNLKKANITQTRRPFRQRQQQAVTPPLHYQANYTAMAQPVIPA
ncbi:hypothetical protein BB560_005071, partial [Smittium megazygosporum]